VDGTGETFDLAYEHACENACDLAAEHASGNACSLVPEAPCIDFPFTLGSFPAGVVLNPEGFVSAAENKHCSDSTHGQSSGSFLS
jgi:hypothetical protein